MAGGKVQNLVQIANRRIDILNGRLAAYDCEMYPVPEEPTEEYVRVMVGDLDWMMESVEHEIGRDEPVFQKYVDVRERLSQLHDELRSDITVA